MKIGVPRETFDSWIDGWMRLAITFPPTPSTALLERHVLARRPDTTRATLLQWIWEPPFTSTSVPVQ